MKRILTNQSGVTVLEGVIALGLLAVVTAGAFGVLLSASRQSSQPDMNEEMMLAVERANDLLKAYTDSNSSHLLPSGLQRGPCNSEAAGTNPLDLGTHTHALNCLLPSICDTNGSSFSYTVANAGNTDLGNWEEDDLEGTYLDKRQITFNIVCNGY